MGEEEGGPGGLPFFVALASGVAEHPDLVLRERDGDAARAEGLQQGHVQGRGPHLVDGLQRWGHRALAPLVAMMLEMLGQIWVECSALGGVGEERRGARGRLNCSF